MNPQNRKYYLILVHYGDSKTTDRALRSLKKTSEPPDYVVVVNNDTGPYANEEANMIVNAKQNQGYAGGVNMGFGALTTMGASVNDVVICMNNDIEILESTFAQLRSFFLNSAQPGLVNVSIEERGCAVKGSYVNLFTGRTHLNKSAEARRRRAYHIPAIHGAFFAATCKTFAQLQGMPEQYFMYWEDAAMSLLAHSKSIPISLASEVRVRHDVEKDEQASRNQEYYLVRNGAHVLEQSTAPHWRVYWKAANHLRRAYHARFSGKKNIAQALIDAQSGQLGKRV